MTNIGSHSNTTWSLFDPQLLPIHDKRNGALKEVGKEAQTLTEFRDYERNVLYPLATEQVPIRLIDGLKIICPSFDAALKKIVGLNAKEKD